MGSPGAAGAGHVTIQDEEAGREEEELEEAVRGPPWCASRSSGRGGGAGRAVRRAAGAGGG
eukprot:15159975-Alexandrium_andersonii.AAC.1